VGVFVRHTCNREDWWSFSQQWVFQWLWGF
jgi:hypothetical protein